MKKHEYPKTGDVIYSEILENGLKVYYLPKNDYHKVYGLFTTSFGSLDTTFGGKTYPEGIAHFLEHKLFEKEDGDVMYKFSALGAQTNAFTSFSRTSYLFSTQENAAECVKLLLDFVQKPYFTEENVKKEQGIIQQEIEMYRDDSDWQLFSGLLARLYPETALAADIAGTPETIWEITANDLYENHVKFYQPSNMNLFLTGNFDLKEIAELVRQNQAAKDFVKQEKFERTEVALNPVKSDSSINFEVAQPKLGLGFRGNDELPTDEREFLDYKMSNIFLMEMMFGKTSNRYEALYNQEIIDDSFGHGFDSDLRFHYSFITADTDKADELTEIVKTALENFEMDENFNDEHLALIKKETLGDFYKSLNSLEFIAHQFSSNLTESISFFELPEMVANLDLTTITKYAKQFTEKMEMVKFTVESK